MRNKLIKLGLSIMFVLAICLGIPQTTFALDYESFEAVYENDDTGYEVYLDDWANLLSKSEEKDLLEIMEPITEYGNVAFVTIDHNPKYDTEKYAEEYYKDHFGKKSGTVFVIDMQERYLYIHSNGDIYDTITSDYAYTITDNVYTYASDEEYYECAERTFEQILTLLEGRTIAQPMKYISNALLAIVIALLLNYFLVMLLSRSKKASDRQVLTGIFTKVDVSNTVMNFQNQTKRYSPQSSGSSGGGGSSGGSGGGGGGGGGGHSF